MQSCHFLGTHWCFSFLYATAFYVIAQHAGCPRERTPSYIQIPRVLEFSTEPGGEGLLDGRMHTCSMGGWVSGRIDAGGMNVQGLWFGPNPQSTGLSWRRVLQYRPGGREA